MKTAFAFVLVGITIVACGDDDADDGTGAPTGATKDYVAIDTEKFCSTAVTCETTLTKESCVAAYGTYRIPPACKAKLENFTCAQPASEVFSPDCFPACSDFGSGTCDGDRITSCSSSLKKRITLDCPAGCATQNKKFVRCGQNQGSTETKCLCE